MAICREPWTDCCGILDDPGFCERRLSLKTGEGTLENGKSRRRRERPPGGLSLEERSGEPGDQPFHMALHDCAGLASQNSAQPISIQLEHAHAEDPVHLLFCNGGIKDVLVICPSKRLERGALACVLICPDDGNVVICPSKRLERGAIACALSCMDEKQRSLQSYEGSLSVVKSFNGSSSKLWEDDIV